jgi:demethylmenaquinone methyltransferase / 2-methoxy-6-polyprenyl-1,4-benzoquinol methylase
VKRPFAPELDLPARRAQTIRSMPPACDGKVGVSARDTPRHSESALAGPAPYCYGGAQMANVFYEPGAQRARQVQALFSRIAPRYDLINDLQSFGLHRHWKRRLLALAGPIQDRQILDLCCGTGDVAWRFAQAGAKVVAVDFSGPMLSVAQRRTGSTGPPVQWVQADALRLPFRSSQFDVVTISYGLRNLADFEQGLCEMHRVSKPGGRLLILDFGKPGNAVLRGGYAAYLRFWVPLFGRCFCGDGATYAYILESLKHYPAQEGVASLLSRLRCQKIRVDDILGGTMSIHCAEK